MSCFDKNLTALSAHHYLRSVLPSVPENMLDHWFRLEGQNLSFLIRKRFVAVENQNNLFKTVGSVLNVQKHLIILGIGSGTLVDLLLSQTEMPITVYEKHPGFFHLAFRSFDWSEHIHSGRLKFKDPFTLATDSTPESKFQVVQHPGLSAFYRDLAPLLNSTPTSAKLHVLMEGELLIDDWYDTLTEAGFRTYIYPHFWNPMPTISQDLAHPKVEHIWSINRIKGLSELAAQTKKTYTIYEIDPDLSDLETPPKTSCKTTVFSFRRKNVSHYVEKGWNAQFLALGTPSRMKSTFSKDHACKVSFVGTSMLKNAIKLKSYLKNHISTDLFAVFESFWQEQLARPDSFLSDIFLRKWLHEGGPNTLTVGTAQLSIAKIFYEWSGAVHRIGIISALAPFDIQVWGDMGWESIAAQNPGMIYRGSAGHRFEVPKIYSSTIINVDVTRSYQPDVATIRLFDVFACSSLAITNYCADEPIFNSELLRFDFRKDIIELVDEILHWPEQRYRDYVNALENEINQRHRLSHRLAAMTKTN